MRYSLAALLLIAGCSGPTAEERIAALEAERAAIHADLLRQRAECQAQALEFRGDPRVVQPCVDAASAMADAAGRVVAMIDKQITELRETR